MGNNQYHRESVFPIVVVDGIREPTARVSEISYSTGARSDYATIVVEKAAVSSVALFERLPLYGFGMGNARSIATTASQVRITDGSGVNIFHGLITNTSLSRNPNEESIEVTVRLDGSISGLPVRGAYTVADIYATAQNSDAFMAAGDLVFNPVIEGIPWPNKWSSLGNNVDVDDAYATAINFGSKLRFSPVFAHHMQADRSIILNDPSESQLNNDARVNFWNIKDVVAYLLNSLNFAQRYVLNPSQAHLNKVFDLYSGATIGGLGVLLGANFFEALEAVCEPFGVSFYVEHRGFKPQLNFYSPVTNTPTDVRFLNLRSYGLDAHHDLDECVSLQLDSDISNQASNDIRIIAGPPVIERTFDLMPAWDDAYDAHDYEALTMDHPDWLGDSNLERVHRDWVANEQGTYSRTTKEVTQTGFDLKRRREPLPTMSMDSAGQSFGSLRGVFVEFSWKNQGWRPVTDLGLIVLILRDEIGIRFADVDALEMSHKDLSEFDMRMTCSTEQDIPIEAFSTDLTQTSWLLNNRLSSVVDMAESFRRLYREPGGNLDALDAVEINDTAKMQSLAAALLNEWNVTTITGSAILSRINVLKFRLGNGISLDTGRRLIASAKRSVPTRLPVVVGLKHDFVSQNTVLQIGHLQTSLGVVVNTI